MAKILVIEDEGSFRFYYRRLDAFKDLIELSADHFFAI